MSGITSFNWIVSTNRDLSLGNVFFFEMRDGRDPVNGPFFGSHYFNITRNQVHQRRHQRRLHQPVQLQHHPLLYSTLPLALRDPQGRRVRRPSTLTAQAREYHPRRQRSVSAWASDLVLASHSRLQTSCGTSVDSKGSFWVCPVHLNHLYVEEHISIITNLKARLRKFSPMCWPRLLCICGQIANLTSYNLDTLRRCIYANFSFTSHASCLSSWLEEWYRNAINAKYLGQTQLDFNQRL